MKILDEVKYFLRPNVSFKTGTDLRGHKGVGATFLAYGYSSFSVQTKQGDFPHSWHSVWGQAVVRKHDN